LAYNPAFLTCPKSDTFDVTYFYSTLATVHYKALTERVS